MFQPALNSAQSIFNDLKRAEQLAKSNKEASALIILEELDDALTDLQGEIDTIINELDVEEGEPS